MHIISKPLATQIEICNSLFDLLKAKALAAVLYAKTHTRFSAAFEIEVQIKFKGIMGFKRP